MLKNKDAKLKPSKKNGIPAMLLGVLIGLGATGAVGGIDYAVTYNQGETYMPFSEVVQFCDDLDLNTSYFSYEQSPNKQNTRAVFPKDGIKLNIFIDNLTEEQKNDMQRAVDDLNAIFKVIRPENKFILELNPSLGDKINKYNIDLYEMPEASSDKTAGQWNPGYKAHNKNGLITYHSKIEIKRAFLNYNCFLHEIFHHLGFGDAYTNLEALDSYTIMMDANLRSKHMHKNDVALLVARYGDYSTPEKKQELINYINNYESQQDWYEEYKVNADRLADKLADNLKIDRSEIEFDLAGKTYIKHTSNSLDLKQSYNMISFDNQKMTDESMEIALKTSSDNISSSYNQSSYFQFLDTIDGINYTDILEPTIYCEVNGSLYVVSETPPIAIGKLASAQDIIEYVNVQHRWEQSDSSTLISEIADTSFNNLSNYIPNVEKTISSGDKLKLYNEDLGEITIDKKATIKGANLNFAYYKGGIFIPISSYDAIFIFPDYYNNYIYIKADRMGSNVKYTFYTLKNADEVSVSTQNQDIDNDL